MKPSHLVLDGVTYELDEGENAFRTIYEPSVIQQPEEVGSSRRAKTARPDVLTWRMDDWNQGEGYKFLRSDDGDASQRGYFYTSAGAVNVLTPGQVSLGYQVASESAGLSTSFTVGPFLGATNSYLVALCGGFNAASRRRNATGTWSDLSTGAVAETIHGIGLLGTYAYTIAETTMRQIDVSANTNANYGNISTVGYNPFPFDNRFHVVTVNTATKTVTLRRNSLADALPVSTTAVYTISGSSGTPYGIDGTGTRIYFVTQESDENVRLHEWDGAVGREIGTFPNGFRVSGGSTKTSSTGLMNLAIVNGVVYVGGMQHGSDTLGAEDASVPLLCYYDGKSMGAVGRVHGRSTLVNVPGARTFSRGVIRAFATTPRRFTALAPGADNLLVLGASDTSASTGLAQGYVYDTTSGGFSELFTGFPAADIVSIAYWRGRYFFGTHGADPEVYSTKTTGSSKHPSTATIEMPIWDFDLPDTEKVLTEVEIHSEALDNGCSVSIKLVLDGAVTEITTDADGNTMTHASGGRSKFHVSGAAVERTFRYCQPKIVLTTTDTSNTPVLYSVTLRATTSEKEKFYEARVNCRKANQTSPAVTTGAKAAQTLQTLVESTSNRIVSCAPYVLGAPPPFPRGANGSSTLENVIIDAASFNLDKQGEGSATLRMRVLAPTSLSGVTPTVGGGTTGSTIFAAVEDVIITTGSEFNFGPDAMGNGATFNTTSAAWSAANRAVYVPIVIPRAGTVYQLFWTNGGTVSGNVDIALYDSSGNRLTSAGSTVMSGATTLQAVDIADYAVTAGRYYIGLSVDNTTATIRGTSLFNNTGQNGAVGIQNQAAAFPLPNPAVMTAPATTFVPHMGLAMRSVV